MPDTERLTDWFPEEFGLYQLSLHPAPRDRVTGKPLWKAGIRLHGQQYGAVMDDYRFLKVDGGIRFGKSFSGAARIYLDWMWRVSERGVTDDLYGIIGDTYAMAQAEMDHIHRLLSERNIPHDFFQPQNQSWRITFPGMTSEIATLTGSDVTKIASKPYRALVLAEAAQLNPDVFEKAVGRVSEGRGWVMLEGTFEKQKGRWYAQLTEQWKRDNAMGVVYTCPSWDNPVVYPGGRRDPEIIRRENSMSRATFLEMYGGEPQMPSEVVMREASEKFNIKRRWPRLGTSFDPEAPVYLFIDPGLAHASATVAAQFYASPEFVADYERQLFFETRPNFDPFAINRGDRVGRARVFNGDGGNICHVIDIIYRWGRHAEDIIREAAARPWAANVTEAVMDFAARQRNANGPAVIEQWMKLWPEFTGRRLEGVHADQVPLAAGYDTHKVALRNAWLEEEAQAQFNWDGKLTYGSVVDPSGPRLYIDPDAAAPFFGGYVDDRDYGGEYYLHKNRVSGRDNSIVSDDPIARDDDAIKAISYGLYWWFGAARTKNRSLGVYTMPFEVVRAS